jgi:hypothetical protein
MHPTLRDALEYALFHLFIPHTQSMSMHTFITCILLRDFAHGPRQTIREGARDTKIYWGGQYVSLYIIIQEIESVFSFVTHPCLENQTSHR